MILIYQEYWFNDIDFSSILFFGFSRTFKEFLEIKLMKISSPPYLSLSLSPEISLPLPLFHCFNSNKIEKNEFMNLISIW